LLTFVDLEGFSPDNARIARSAVMRICPAIYRLIKSEFRDAQIESAKREGRELRS
jgi:hypothetical protein